MKKNEFKTITLVYSKSFILSFYILSTIIFTLLLNHQQIIVGTVVNSLLFFTALHIDKKYHLPIAIFPSIVVVFQGLLFGKLTIFLIYFLPFIWIGNYILMLTVQKFSHYKVLRFFLAAVLKFLFLFLIANFYVNFKIVPKIFLQTMGVFQLITALLGAGVYNLVNKIIKVKND
ncbi:MAG: hypothetical protein Fur009_7290 [Candidatus Microgenomates bacterium]